MKKAIFTFMMVVCILLSANYGTVHAETSGQGITEQTDEEYITLVVYNNDHVMIRPTNAYNICDTTGNTSYRCIEFDVENGKKGFGIIDLTTYEVVMYALDAETPFSEKDKVLYDGVVDFATVNKKENTATMLRTGDTISCKYLHDRSRANVKLISDSEKAEIIMNEENKMSEDEIVLLSSPEMETSSLKSVEASEVRIKGGSDETLVYSAGNNSSPWKTDCGINAIAIYLRHMDKYFNNNYVPTRHESEKALKVALAEKSDKLYHTTQLVSLDRLAGVTNGYLNTYSSGSGISYVSHVTYSWEKYKKQINGGSGRPCILYIPPKATSYWNGAHAVVGVGHTSGATADTGYDIVNSGWVSLKYVRIKTNIPTAMIRS